MSQLSEKELSSLNELLFEEQLLVKKFRMLAGHAEDPDIKKQMKKLSDRHQSHFNRLYQYLS